MDVVHAHGGSKGVEEGESRCSGGVAEEPGLLAIQRETPGVYPLQISKRRSPKTTHPETLPQNLFLGVKPPQRRRSTPGYYYPLHRPERAWEGVSVNKSQKQGRDSLAKIGDIFGIAIPGGVRNSLSLAVFSRFNGLSVSGWRISYLLPSGTPG